MSFLSTSILYTFPSASFANASVEPLYMTFPLFNIATFSHVASISPTICVDKITILSFAISHSKFLNLIRSSGSRPAVGSSTIKTLGL